MAKYNEENMAPTQTRFDGVGCAGSFFLLMLILTIMGAVISNTVTPPTSGLSPTATALALPTSTLAEPALAPVTDTPLPAPTDTATVIAMPTSTATAVTPTSEPPTLTPTMAAVTAVSAAIHPLPTTTTTATITPAPLPTPRSTYSWTLKVPIFMYHYISAPPEDADGYRLGLSVAPDAFRQQMAYLAENGFTTIDLYDLSRAIANKQELPPRPVIITVDDGYRDNYENAFPILQEYGLEATFFLATEFIDQGNPAYMDWAMIEEMAAAGMRFEPHSKTHPDLRGQERDFLVWQIRGSQETIAAHIGYTPRYFAYPSGRYDEATLAVLAELDFWGAVTTRSGKWHGFNDRYEWTRLRVRNNTPLSEFIDLVEPGDTVGGKPVGD